VACFTLWGLFPLFFQAVGRAGASAWEVVGWRVLAAVPVCAALVWISGQIPACRALLRQPRALGLLATSGLLVGVNWGIFIWAVQHGQVLATSLGYYLNPLLNVAFGAALFGERLRPPALVALALAVIGVALQAWAIQGLPWVTLALALSFSLYGVIRKHVAVEAQTGLLVETLALSIPSAAFVGWEMAHGAAAFGTGFAVTAWLLACGPATVVPLVAFAFAARRLPLSTLGFLQFIQPTMTFAVGAWQGEPVGALRLLSFGFIWAGVAIFIANSFRPAVRP
jgi:chloramphenicol-sensitive protein RarD